MLDFFIFEGIKKSEDDNDNRLKRLKRFRLRIWNYGSYRFGLSYTKEINR
jgi:hypothetical protein